MKLKLASALPANVLEALYDLMRPLYAKPGMRVIGIVELAHIERNEIAPDEDKEPSVADHFALRETARLRAAMKHQAETLSRLRSVTFSEFDLRKQIDRLHGIVTAALEWREDDEGDE